MTVNHENYGFIKQIWYLLRRVIYYIEKKVYEQLYLYSTFIFVRMYYM